MFDCLNDLHRAVPIRLHKDSEGAWLRGSVGSKVAVPVSLDRPRASHTTLSEKECSYRFRKRARHLLPRALR